MNKGLAVNRITELLDGTKVNDIYLVVGGDIGTIQCAEPLSHQRLYPKEFGTKQEFGLIRYDQVGKWLCNEEVSIHPAYFNQMQSWLAEEFR